MHFPSAYLLVQDGVWRTSTQLCTSITFSVFFPILGSLPLPNLLIIQRDSSYQTIKYFMAYQLKLFIQFFILYQYLSAIFAFFQIFYCPFSFLFRDSSRSQFVLFFLSPTFLLIVINNIIIAGPKKDDGINLSNYLIVINSL